MYSVGIENDFESWRAAARDLLLRGATPDEISWSSDEQPGLFLGSGSRPIHRGHLTVSAEFVRLGQAVACYDDTRKWSLLYRILFRLMHENRNLLKIESDPDVRDARVMEKAVRRDVHKFHAFVRFRRVECGDDEIYTAWHEPQHFTVPRALPFFMRRFGSMKFSILTPKGCGHWDLQALTFTEGLNAAPPGAEDESEQFWLTYYRSIFNPFRLKINAMKSEMPVRHWPTLPEARLIPELIRSASGRQTTD